MRALKGPKRKLPSLAGSHLPQSLRDSGEPQAHFKQSGFLANPRVCWIHEVDRTAPILVTQQLSGLALAFALGLAHRPVALALG